MSEDPSEPKAPLPPTIQVIKGQPTDSEVAALIAVLRSAGGGPPEVVAVELNRWGIPEERLRYGLVSWQQVTLLERAKMRR